MYLFIDKLSVNWHFAAYLSERKVARF